jgi:hypothetical protein
MDDQAEYTNHTSSNLSATTATSLSIHKHSKEFDDFKDALHRWKETTSTSPSGRHLGHYISLLKNINNEKDEISDCILRLHHTMLQIASTDAK